MVLPSIVSELPAYTAVGLVARLGEVFPRWVPVLRGRSVPVAGLTVLAGAGATVLTLLSTWTAVSFGLGRRVDGRLATGPKVLEPDDWQGWLAVVSYAPLLLRHSGSVAVVSMVSTSASVGAAAASGPTHAVTYQRSALSGLVEAPMKTVIHITPPSEAQNGSRAAVSWALITFGDEGGRIRAAAQRPRLARVLVRGW